ncbi:hypothetical protein GBA52_020525, partial [Prunus armeniaca]
ATSATRPLYPILTNNKPLRRHLHHSIKDAHQLVPLIGSIEAFVVKGKTRLL